MASCSSCSCESTKSSYIYIYICDCSQAAGPTFKSDRRHWSNLLAPNVMALERTRECFQRIEEDPLLGYDLMKMTSSTVPGQILKHCYQAVDRILAAQAPCIFKIGYSHCAHFRFYNQKFGYKHDKKCGWERMIVIYAACETISPGYIEAAIIQRHKGILNAQELYNSVFELQGKWIYIQLLIYIAYVASHMR